jgi:hypothetical protein
LGICSMSRPIDQIPEHDRPREKLLALTMVR